VVGQSTRAQAEALLGPPTSASRDRPVLVWFGRTKTGACERLGLEAIFVWYTPRGVIDRITATFREPLPTQTIISRLGLGQPTRTFPGQLVSYDYETAGIRFSVGPGGVVDQLTLTRRRVHARGVPR